MCSSYWTARIMRSTFRFPEVATLPTVHSQSGCFLAQLELRRRVFCAAKKKQKIFCAAKSEVGCAAKKELCCAELQINRKKRAKWGRNSDFERNRKDVLEVWNQKRSRYATSHMCRFVLIKIYKLDTWQWLFGPVFPAQLELSRRVRVLCAAKIK